MSQWRKDGELLFCPECHHGQQAHYSVTGLPIACEGARGRYWHPRAGQMVGKQRGSGDGYCACGYALHRKGTAA